jgi:MFS family permease
MELVYYLGCLIGALPAGWLGDKLGRLKTMLIVSYVWITFFSISDGS